MIRLAPMILLLAPMLALAACASSSAYGNYANYDTLKQAQDACAAKGGTMVLRAQGDPQSIDAYACKRN